MPLFRASSVAASIGRVTAPHTSSLARRLARSSFRFILMTGARLTCLSRTHHSQFHVASKPPISVRNSSRTGPIIITGQAYHGYGSASPWALLGRAMTNLQSSVPH
ncbi:uncharacterized protein SEPMUDRAFT_148541 [Sphaerulina musiva SO2202]|uniref:Uncharacterized protein n=1 Tax=Sphaerulina musiva (strain SO2202) TaxID=692275 RepID=M3D4L7_SPHMS|nr:uncharacterized protein SEPMUDRAFT_148541 [Sphaerulina musiva SO2202]EMF13160.1 hypothetical protein SEPMUDRAFT_148541 [Sphaerulina musiva SO2202]